MFVVACQETESESPTDTGVAEDVHDHVDISDDASDIADEGDAALVDTIDEDASFEGCRFPEPRQSPDPRVTARAESPEKCGQQAYEWLQSDALGDVTGYGYDRGFTASALRAVLQTQNIVAPRDVTYDVRLRQYTYLTQNRGELIEASSFVAHPTNFGDDSPREVLLFLHGTAGFNDECAPSEDLGTQALVALFASFGYIVVAPDYIGMKALGEPTGFLHPYLVGEATAMASLDAVRAMGKLPAEELRGQCVAPRIVTFGGSQGGHAALWVDRLGPYYAPELELLGGVATVPPADLVGQAIRGLQSRVSATGNTLAFMATVAPWYGVDDAMTFLKEPWDVTIPESLATNCSPGRIIRDIETLDEVFTEPILDAAQNNELIAPWDCITGENGLTTTTVERLQTDSASYGLLFVVGEDDNLVHPPIQREAFDTLCEQGMPLQYLECAGGRHGPTTGLALPEILDFIEDRLQGVPFAAGDLCARAPAVTCRGELP